MEKISIAVLLPPALAMEDRNDRNHDDLDYPACAAVAGFYRHCHLQDRPNDERNRTGRNQAVETVIASHKKWTPRATAKLAELWNSGHGASYIAAELGRPRNSVLGKIWRLRLAFGDDLIKRPFDPAKATYMHRASFKAKQGDYDRP